MILKYNFYLYLLRFALYLSIFIITIAATIIFVYAMSLAR